ncbi:hypothetical protein IWW50_001532, partial [Coemansia erecta]
HYDDYARHARLMTEIHAKPKTAVDEKMQRTDSENQDPAETAAKKPTKDKQRKKNLKRF